MISLESISIMFLLCVIEAAPPPAMKCTWHFPNEDDARNGSLATWSCDRSEREVMEIKSGREENSEGNSTRKIGNGEGGNETKAENGTDRKTEVSRGLESGMRNDQKLDQKLKPIEVVKPSEKAVVSSTRPKRSPCNGRSKKNCKGKRRQKNSKKRNSRRRRAAKAQRKRRH